MKTPENREWQRNMKIRIINENDWEKSYDLDKSIIRVGSQISCDVQIRDTNVQPFLMQIVRSGSVDIRYVMRCFADNIMITRGNQVFPASTMVPYDVLDGDKISFSKYRMIINLEDERTRVRSSMHMKAVLYLSRRELSLEAPINGVMQLNNLGTDKPCQFRMRIDGIPADCLQAAPLPYLYPGGSSSVGFVISHLRTRPGPGFHTVSITISAPDEYFGEILEFNQDIYVNPVFDNEIILEDDSNSLTGFNKKLQESLKESADKSEPVKTVPTITDARRLDANAEMVEEQRPTSQPVRVEGKSDNGTNPFEDSDEDVSEPYARTKHHDSFVVIRHDENDAFDTDAAGASQVVEEVQTIRRRTKRTKKEVSAENREADENADAAIQVNSSKPADEPKDTGKKSESKKSRKIPKNVPVIKDQTKLFEGESADEKEPPSARLVWPVTFVPDASQEAAAEVKTGTDNRKTEEQAEREVPVTAAPEQPAPEMQSEPEAPSPEASEMPAEEKQAEPVFDVPDVLNPVMIPEGTEPEASAADKHEQRAEGDHTEPEITVTADTDLSIPEESVPVEMPAAVPEMPEADEKHEEEIIMTLNAAEPQSEEPLAQDEKSDESVSAESAAPEVPAAETPVIAVPNEPTAQAEKESEPAESAAVPQSDKSEKPARKKKREKKQVSWEQNSEEPVPEEPQFLNVKGMDGSQTIPVITNSQFFDDAADTGPEEDSRSAGSTAKAEVRVVKGGSFDD